jgi:adenylate kinase
MAVVMYLTGAPATGKSTLCSNLAKANPAAHIFAYSNELRQLVAGRTHRVVTEGEIREKSAAIVTPADVLELDKRLIALVAAERTRRPIIIDSHAVTKELYGFRVTSFSAEQLRQLDPDLIVCLYASPDAITARIAAKPMGRPQISLFEAALHVQLQAAVATQYGVLLGKPVYLVDADVPEEVLAEQVGRKLRNAS